MELKKNVLITGAARGIGLEIKNTLFEHGSYNVFAPTRTELDLLDLQSIEKFLATCPGIDILINNAGINILEYINEIHTESIQEMINTNLISPIYLTKFICENMKKNGFGRIINISSIWGVNSKEKRTLYSVTKFGINGLTKALSKELGPYNILVNSVSPGYVDTELTRKNVSPVDKEKILENIPLRRFAQPNEIANLISFLISPKNTYITGQNIVIDGGFL